MSSSENTKKSKLTLLSLVLMIFTSVFGFANMPRAFYLMGYGAIPWYIFAAFTFFIPFAFMMAEYGAAFKNETGGIYSWMSISVSPKFAFIGTFMWYASYIIWMVNVGTSIWVVVSTAIFGTDLTATWSILVLNSTQTLGLLGICWILFVTFVSTKGLDKIKKITSIGGTAVALLNILLVVGAVVVFIGSGGNIAQPITSASSFFVSPNPAYTSPIAILGFLVFAIFAFGGTEVAGGLVDQTENAEKTFPRGIMISAVVISIGYAIGIFCVGIFTNFGEFLTDSNVTMGNVAYLIMNNLGFQIGQVLGMSQTVSISIGNWIGRFVGISMLLALTGAFFTLTYSPLKQLIQGTPKELWPNKLSKLKNDIPQNAMWVQAIIVIVMIFLVSFGGDSAQAFFKKLILMTNVAITLPYMFIALAFIGFKKKDSIHKPFVIYKNKIIGIAVALIVTITVGFANIFTIIEPATNGDIASTLWSIGGPVFFTGIALVMYKRYEKKYLNK